MEREDDAGELWDHVVGLARVPGFAELKRSLRERPQISPTYPARIFCLARGGDWNCPTWACSPMARP